MHVAENNPNMELWHCRFGHLGKDNLSKLVNNDMVTGMVSSKDEDMPDVCEACIMGKQCHTLFPKRSFSRATELFEIVVVVSYGHTPMCVSSSQLAKLSSALCTVA